MAHQQRVAGGRIVHHMVHRIHLGRNQGLHRQQLVVVAIARVRAQADPFVRGATQPRVGGDKIIHLLHVDRLARVVRAAQAYQDVVAGLAGRDAVLEVQVPIPSAMQRYGFERSQITAVVAVNRAGHRPTRGVVGGKEVHVVELHLAALELCRPAAVRGVHGELELLRLQRDELRRRVAGLGTLRTRLRALQLRSLRKQRLRGSKRHQRGQGRALGGLRKHLAPRDRRSRAFLLL